MTTRTALFALLAMWGVGTLIDLPAIAEDKVAGAQADDDADDDDASPTKRSLINRVWVKEDEAGLPGVMRIFLSDGTLVQDSCWETHRLSEWKMTADNAVSWNEDGMDISAEILAVSADSLTLALKLGNDTVEEHYTPAAVPYVCPDMPK
ncbi:MAG TPA: hypothetical protein PK286_14555 [Devosia sp.]|nr:hypothetical protein [Devosia sp.]